jgi:hypothetical protein
MPLLAELVRRFVLSSYRENLFEQIFCAELLQGCWLAGLQLVEMTGHSSTSRAMTWSPPAAT